MGVALVTKCIIGNLPYVGKFWRIWQMVSNSPKFSPPIFINIMKYRIIRYYYNCRLAGLLKYFKLKRCNEGNDDEGKLKDLPDPNGELSKVVPSSSI